jgi:CheY-like chemotaxis protein
MAQDESPRSLHVLIAEDTPEVRLMAVAILRKNGHHVSEATTGREAVEAAAAEPPDVILMDVQMPDMDGIDATREIREAESWNRRVPILAFTAGGPDAKPERCLEAGMDAFLRKPINAPVLIEAVERYGSGGAATELPGNEPPAHLVQMAGGDPEHLRSMAKVFLEFAPIQVEKLEAAQEDEDSGTMAVIARDLRGSAKVFGADTILIPTERLEFLASRGITDMTRPLVEVIAREVQVLEKALERLGG